MTALPKPGTPVSHRLRVNANGAIVLETREPGRVSSGFAPDLRYHLEYKSVKSWVAVHGSYDNDATARRVLAESNGRITWRLVASNQYGSVALPKGWRGYYR